MKQTRLLMGMPITIHLADALEPTRAERTLDRVFAYFARVDDIFSTYKDTSEIARINRGELTEREASDDVKTIFFLAEQTRRETDGYFDIRHAGQLDPSGIVKGWAVLNAARRLQRAGLRNFYVDAGGDAQLAGRCDGRPWRVGIRNPFNRHEHVKVLALSDCGVATSGIAIRGQHIYNPFQPSTPITDVLSLTVIGPDVYEADRFATAAFAMGRRGISFIERLPGFEGYLIDTHARATYTSGFERYVAQP